MACAAGIILNGEGLQVKILNAINKVKIKLYLYYQSLQHFLLSIMVMGILDYFFLYEILVAILPAVPILMLEAGIILAIVTAIMAIRGFIRYTKRKAQANKHFLFLSL